MAGAYGSSNGTNGESVYAGPSQREFDLTMGVWLPGIICVIGILGNLLALIVLSRDNSRSTTFYSLRALASSDLILLTSAMLQQVIPMICVTSGQVSNFCLKQGYIRVYSWPVVCTAQMTSIWFTVMISAERYVAICHPLQAVRMCTIPKVRTTIIAITTISVLFNIPKFFEFRPEPRNSGPPLNVTYIEVGGTPLREDQLYRYLYNTALYCLVIYALPLTSLTVMNVKIVREMRKAKKQWELLNRHQQRELKATVLPLCIVFVFFVCGTQSLIAFILDAIFVEQSKWLQFYTAIVNVLVITNSAVNFILMYVFGKKFRSLLKDFLLCKDKSAHSPILTETFHV